MSRSSRLSRLLGLVLFVSLLPLTAMAGTAATSAAPAAPAKVEAAAATGRRADLSLALVSRTVNAATNNWTVVVEATLDSNYLCFPLVFDCIVGELTDPSNAALTDLQCLSPHWNHLAVFRSHCLRQTGHAGQESKFRFTYLTDPGVATGNVVLSAEFGRGVLPVTFQQIASANITVNLDTFLDLTQSCPDTVNSGAMLICTMTVTYPFSSGPSIAATLVGQPDGTLISGGSLAHLDGAPNWSCGPGLTCSATVNPGESSRIAYATIVAATSTGGEGYNRVLFTAGGAASVTDDITVVGTGDAFLGITKTAVQQSVRQGDQVTYTVTVDNNGGTGGSDVAATNVEVADTAPALVSGMTLSYTSGVGTWTCSGLVCTTASMPKGSATFTATGTLSAEAPVGGIVLNEVGVTWTNDVFGPDFPEVAGAAATVEQGATTTTSTPTSTTAAPGSTTTTIAVPRTGGIPISFAG